MRDLAIFHTLREGVLEVDHVVFPQVCLSALRSSLNEQLMRAVFRRSILICAYISAWRQRGPSCGSLRNASLISIPVNHVEWEKVGCPIRQLASYKHRGE